MGLIRFLRQRFAGPEMQPEPSPPAVPPPRPRPSAAPDAAALPMLRRGSTLTSPAAANTAAASAPAPPGQDILRFSERRDARLAVVIAPDAREEILRLHQMIDQLHRQRRRLLDDRDRWQRLAGELEKELVALRRGEMRGGTSPLAAADKFRRAKTVLARLTHPDSSGASGAEAAIRAQLFQEFWAEFERIDAE